MRKVEVWSEVPGGDAQRLFDVIAALERYPEMTDAVRSVQVETLPDGRLASEWEVNFRNGVLRWAEHDELDPAAGRIAFEQTTGDFAHFAGEWVLEETEAGAAVGFIAEFDLGIPSLSAMLDPIAESALRENISKILDGLIEQPVVTLDERPTGSRDGQVAAARR